MRAPVEMLRAVQKGVNPAVKFEDLSAVEQIQLDRTICAFAGYLITDGESADVETGAQQLPGLLQDCSIDAAAA